MHALHSQELEKVNAELRTRLEAAELDRDKALEAKDAQCAELHSRMRECEARVDVLLRAAEERDRLVGELEEKARLFYEVVEHRTALGRIVEVLEEIHKQQKVKPQAAVVREKNETLTTDVNGALSPPHAAGSEGSPPADSVT